MGVPAFFAWLAKRYGVVSVLPAPQGRMVNGQQQMDLMEDNDCHIHFDCLYLDLNALIHPACHPEDREAPKTEEAMMTAIFDAIDFIFAIIRPRKLVYMAVDGVAPRAKMNHQRARRFRTAQDAAENAEMIEKKLVHFEQAGIDVSAFRSKRETDNSHFDSNCITPGTQFLDRVSQALRYYIALRISTEPAWQQLRVVFSDANVPGEGEHKIIDFIRRQRCAPGYDPNQTHVLYGADADLVMLGLGLHEAAMYVLRENLRTTRNICRLCGAPGHTIENCTGDLLTAKLQAPTATAVNPQPFLLVDLAHLRHLLKAEVPKGQAGNVDQYIDDWIFLCFFVGNDFLPHLPSLSIREGAIDTLVQLYKQVWPKLDGNINEDGVINIPRLQTFLQHLGQLEDQVCRQRIAEAMGAARQQQLMQREGKIPDHRLKHQLQLAAMDAEDQQRFSSLVLVTRERVGSAEGLGISLPLYLLPGHEEAAGEKAEAERQAEEEAALDLEGEEEHSGDADDARREQPHTKSAKRASNPKTGAAERARKVFDANWIPQLDGGDVEEKAGGNGVDHSADAAAESRKKKKKRNKKKNKESREEAGPVELNPRLAAPPAPAPAPTSARTFAERLKAAKHASAFAVAKAAEFASQPSVLLQAMETAGGPAEAPPVILQDDEHFKELYYSKKFLHSAADADFLRKLSHAYVRGLCWVAQYYFCGCPSWSFYFPFNYAPFASDFGSLEGVAPTFAAEEDEGPVRPFVQLLSVLPPASAGLLPPAWARLMLDGQSPLSAFYPASVTTDLNGKQYAWQGVTLLPFIDMNLLREEVAKIDELLTAEERHRNRIGSDVVLAHQRHALVTWWRQEEVGGAKTVETKRAKRDSQLADDILVWPFAGPRAVAQHVATVPLASDVHHMGGLIFESEAKPPLQPGAVFAPPAFMPAHFEFVSEAEERGYICTVAPPNHAFVSARLDGATTPVFVLRREEKPTRRLEMGRPARHVKGSQIARSVGYDVDRRPSSNEPVKLQKKRTR